MSKNLYVGNLAFSTTADDLREAFSQYGNVTRAQVVSDRETARPIPTRAGPSVRAVALLRLHLPILHPHHERRPAQLPVLAEAQRPRQAREVLQPGQLVAQLSARQVVLRVPHRPDQ